MLWGAQQTGGRWNNSIQHRTTPHYTAKRHTTPHHTTLPHYTAKHHSTPHYAAEHYTTPHHTTQHRTTKQNTTQLQQRSDSQITQIKPNCAGRRPRRNFGDDMPSRTVHTEWAAKVGWGWRKQEKKVESGRPVVPVTSLSVSKVNPLATTLNSSKEIWLWPVRPKMLTTTTIIIIIE